MNKSIEFDVVLLSLNWYRRKDPRTPLSSAYIASYCYQHLDFGDHNLHLIDTDVRNNLSDTIHQIIVINPKVLGIGVYTWNLIQVKLVLSALDQLHFKGSIVLGGPEITYGDDTLVDEFPTVEYFVRGDGEKAFVEILKAVQQNSIIHKPGIYHRATENFNQYTRLTSFDEVYPPHLNEKLQKQLIGKEFTRWQLQRGCLYRCSFCAFPNGSNGFLEFNNLNLIKQQLELFVSHGVKEVAVLDPIFFVHKNRAKQILSLIKEICPMIRFEIQTKLEHLDDELIGLIADLNIVLECGIQTLDPVVQEEIKRKNNKDMILNQMQKLVVKNIEFETHLIYGLPYQDLTSFLNDYQLVQKYCKTIQVFPLSLLRGTHLAQIFEKNTRNFTFSPIFPNQVIKTSWMSSEVILKIKQGRIHELL